MATNRDKKLMNKLGDALLHSRKMFLETGDKEYLGQEYALTAVLVAIDSDDFDRLDHLSTFIKKEHQT